MKKQLFLILIMMMALCASFALAEDMIQIGEFKGYVYEENLADLVQPAFSDDRESLFLPQEADGLRMGMLAASNLPDTVKTLYINRETNLYGYSDLRERTFLVFRYADYDQVQARDHWKERVPQMQPGDIALVYVNLFNTQKDEYQDVDERIPAQSLPTELNGIRVHWAFDNSVLLYTSGQFEYQDNGDGNVEILNCLVHEEESQLFVPAYLEGKK